MSRMRTRMNLTQVSKDSSIYSGLEAYSKFEICELELSQVFTKKSEYNKIYYLIEGELEVNYNQHKTILVRSNEFFLVTSSSLHTFCALSKCKFIVYAFSYISDKWASCKIERLANLVGTLNFSFNKICGNKMINIFFSNLAEYASHFKSQEFIEIKEKELFYILFSYYSNVDLYTLFYEIASYDSNFKAFVIKNHLKVRGVSELAQLSGFSLSTFKRRFIENFGESVYSWMQKQKSKHIIHLFKNEKVIFSEIITSYGFSSPSHFTRFCKKYYGVTPSELREMVKDENFLENSDIAN